MTAVHYVASGSGPGQFQAAWFAGLSVYINHPPERVFAYHVQHRTTIRLAQ
jgi:hypothetical protein